MNKNRENVVSMFTEQQTASVTHIVYKDLTILDRVSKTFSSVMNVLLFIVRHIVSAILTLMWPIFGLVIGIMFLISYLLFGVSFIALFVADDISKILEIMAGSAILYLLCKMMIYILARIKYKVG